MKILLATEKPFAPVAVKGIEEIFQAAGHEVKKLEKYADKSALHAALADADAVIVRSDILDAEALSHAPSLKIAVRAGAGYDNIDLAAATSQGVVVENTPGQNSNAVAELAVGLLLAAVRNQYNGTSGCELRGRRIGIVAFGAIGARLAKICHDGFGMDVLAFSPTGRPEKIKAAGFRAAETLEEVFSTCDVVSLHLPATPQTRGSIGYDLVSRMPKGGVLLNTARKEIIDEAGLNQALAERTDLRYATDLQLADESHAADFGTRYVCTQKKMGAQTAEANINAGLAAARQICAFFENGDETFRVNPR